MLLILIYFLLKKSMNIHKVLFVLYFVCQIAGICPTLVDTFNCTSANYSQDVLLTSIESFFENNQHYNQLFQNDDLILQEIFKMNYSISENALEEIKLLLKKNTVNEIMNGSKKFGESYEKGFLFAKIEKIKEKNNKLKIKKRK